MHFEVDPDLVDQLAAGMRSVADRMSAVHGAMRGAGASAASASGGDPLEAAVSEWTSRWGRQVDLLASRLTHNAGNLAAAAAAYRDADRAAMVHGEGGR